MKIRIWTGRETLASIHGKRVSTFEALESWLKRQPDGVLQVWAGRRWWTVSKESRPFTLTEGKLICRYRPYLGKLGIDPADHPGFFAFEAWKLAGYIVDMYTDPLQIAADLSSSG